MLIFEYNVTPQTAYLTVTPKETTTNFLFSFISKSTKEETLINVVNTSSSYKFQKFVFNSLDLEAGDYDYVLYEVVGSSTDINDAIGVLGRGLLKVKIESDKQYDLTNNDAFKVYQQ